MAMLSPLEFESDLFVSYAHIDDQALTEGQKGWISTFHRALEIRLGQILGKQPRIWRDPKLQGNDYFADRLVEKLPRSAALVSVVSPRYVRSDWCRREVEEFCKASHETGGLRVADKARVFKVVKTPVPLEQHPAELQPLLGYDFFTVEPDTGRPRELNHMAEPDAQRKYWARLDDLAHDISDLLELLEAGRERTAEAPRAGSRLGVGGKGFVYLAETSFDLREKRDALKRELQGDGYSVLPDCPLPLFGPECEAMVREQLARCRLSIHLVGQNYGVVPEGSTVSVVALQNELAVERGVRGADAGFSRLIWMPPGLASADERQQSFLAYLRADPRVQGGADLLETPLEDFKAVLQQRLEPPPEPASRSAPADSEDGPSRVYLICDQRDLEATPPLEDYLFDQGLEVILPAFDGDEAQVRRDHEESLALCDAALVYYGAGSELWLRQKIREIQKAAAYGRTGPIVHRAVYVGPPEGAQKKRFRTHEALVLQAPAEIFAPAALQTFLNQLKTRVGVPA
jgi:hypothetical protein